MKFLGNQSIRRKLMLLLLLTSGTTLLLSAVGFSANDWISQRSAAYERLRAQAGIIGSNSVAALIFRDEQAAAATLSSLEREAEIVGAALFDLGGERFAVYQRDNGNEGLPSSLPPEEAGSLGGGSYVVSPILLESERIGSILILSDFRHWKQRRLLHLIIALGVLVVTLLAAWLLSSRLQRVVSEPILALAATARRVSLDRDYGLRAEEISSDEIGRLVGDFNDMLAQIQLRDQELRHAREELETKVQARTMELTELASQLEHQAYHDKLTGLANRVLFDEHLRQSIDESERYGGRLGVMFLDLDRFKNVNDTLGHAVGDKLLQEVARRFTACLRKSDTLARLGGDEFAVLLVQVKHLEDVAEVARKLIDAMAQPIQVDGYSLHLTTSVGISLYPEDGTEADTIVKNADTAMYRSKDQGRNQATFFAADMNARAVRRMALETRLREAMEHNLFLVEYQPRWATSSREMVGVEALVRWCDEHEGSVEPSEFIPLAEECGLVTAIDEWVLETACREVMRWYNGREPGIRLAVNFSPAHFIRDDLSEVIAGILDRTGFPARRLELEITENLFGPDHSATRRVLERLRGLGIEFCIDDFGTAYSSLSRLKQLPLHTLKIDRAFVRDLGNDPDDEAIVRTIITMAHSLNLGVVAEGIETEAQFGFVQQLGCDAVQGYLLGRPQTGEAMAEQLRSADRGSGSETGNA